ncbi:MAG TPA: phosphotransferase [Steroidobacteraceae bacterium]|nr:phosphotransferase [Steroidobacteraceae bacterium]
MTDDQHDARLSELMKWAEEQLGDNALQCMPASADASFRRYFRITHGLNTCIAMDAPPDKEDVRPFLHVAALLRSAGVHVPEVIASDITRGYLLLSDLGTQTYLDVLNETSADELFSVAIDALIRWQLASKPGELPVYDEALLQRELNLFPEWFIGRHLQRDLDEARQQALQQMFSLIIRRNLSQSRVFVHRDYMPRNLMISTPNPGVLDFQDAVYGPISYDVASLFRDAFISWPEERIIDWAAKYWERARHASLPVPGDFGQFYCDLEWMGLQRHLKVLGIFARINYRDGKPRYLADTPRFIAYVRHTVQRYDELRPLLKLFDLLELQ